MEITSRTKWDSAGSHSEEHSIFSLKLGKFQSEIRAFSGGTMENVSQVAKSFKVDLCYCLVLNRRKQKEKNGSAILQTADGLF